MTPNLGLKVTIFFKIKHLENVELHL